MSTQQSPSPPLEIVYCTDEHIAVRNPNDFLGLVPRWQSLASGTDGFISGKTPWRLYSQSANFVVANVQPGNVVLLTAPTASFPGGGTLYAVDAVDVHTLDMRGIGQQTAAGDPPGSSVNMNGISYKMPTFGPQIEDASFEINLRYRIDPSWPGRMPTNLRDRRDLRAATVLVVLCRHLEAAVTGSGNFPALKLQTFQAELSAVLGRLQLRWGQVDSDVISPTSSFSTRIVR